MSEQQAIHYARFRFVKATDFKGHGSYKFVSPSGERFDPTDLVEFCQQHKLSYGLMRDLSSGRRRNVSGWRHADRM